MPEQVADDKNQARIQFSCVLQRFLAGELSEQLPARYADMMFELWWEHRDANRIPIAHPRALRAAVAGAQSVGGEGAEGGDVHLFDGRRREFKVYAPVHRPLHYKAFADKLREKSRQAGVYEVFMQVEREGCNTPTIKAKVNQFMREMASTGDIAAVKHLDELVIFDGNGCEIWRGKPRG